MADGGPQDAIGHALPGPKRAFGRSLGDFRIEGAATPNGLHLAEERLLDCAASGEECSIALDRPEEATPENTVRGAFLRFLLLGGDEDALVHEKGVILHGGFIEGGIDLESAKDVHSFWFWRCHIGQPINGRNANFDDITLQQCQLGNLNFRTTSISGDVFLDGSRVKGETNFDGSEIGGSVFLREGFEAEGEVRFPGAEIGGQLGCSGAKLKNAAGMALVCDGAKVTGDVFLQEGFEAEGEVRFSGAEIGGRLGCNGAKLKNAAGMALVCDGAKVTGDVFLQEGFEAEGEVCFSGAEIGGAFSCIGGTFRNPKAATLFDDREPRCADAAIDLMAQRLKEDYGLALPRRHLTSPSKLKDRSISRARMHMNWWMPLKHGESLKSKLTAKRFPAMSTSMASPMTALLVGQKRTGGRGRIG